MLQIQALPIPDPTPFIEDLGLSVSNVDDITPIKPGAILQDGHIAIQIGTIGSQSIFVLDGFETAIGCVPLDEMVDKHQWITIFENILSTWERFTK